tara:strand:- start:31 stop:300 length:270 start_codon:yes stop_codon:yes gene_type:complete
MKILNLELFIFLNLFDPKKVSIIGVKIKRNPNKKYEKLCATYHRFCLEDKTIGAEPIKPININNIILLSSLIYWAKLLKNEFLQTNLFL